MIESKSLDNISEQDIQSLIDDKVIETKYLEYKQSLPDNSQKSKDRFLATVVSFANTGGGIIIYGIKENEHGEAGEIIGIDSDNSDIDFRRLQSLIQDGIEPRIPSPNLKEIAVEDKKVYLLKITSSFAKPHRVKNNQTFYGRNTNGRYPLDIEELRNLFQFGETIRKKSEDFIAKRLLKIKSNDFPFTFNKEKIIAIHVIPIASISNQIRLDLRSSDLKLNKFPPLGIGSFNNIYNYDGRMNYFTNHENNMAAYTQIFRSGRIESVNSGILDHEGTNISGLPTENLIREKIEETLAAFPNLSIDLPVFYGMDNK